MLDTTKQLIYSYNPATIRSVPAPITLQALQKLRRSKFTAKQWTDTANVSRPANFFELEYKPPGHSTATALTVSGTKGPDLGKDHAPIATHVPDHIYLEPFVSQKLIDLSYYGVAVGEVLNLHYFHLDTVRRRIYTKEFRKGNLGWFFGLCVSLLYTFFSIYQLINCFIYDSGNKENLITVGFVLIFCTLPIVFQIVSRYSRDELAAFLNNSCIRGEVYVTYLSIEERLKKSFELKFCEVFIVVAYIGIVIVAVLSIAASIAVPNMKIFISSLCTDPNASCHYPTRVISVVVVTCLAYVYAAGGALYCCGMCIVLTWLAGLKDLKSLDIDRHGAIGMMRMYKNQKLLFDSFNRTAALLLPAAECVLMSVSIFGLYGALRLNGILQLAVPSISLLSYCTMVVVFSSLAKIYTASKTLLIGWKRDPRFDRRELGSQRPIRITLGSYAYVDPGLTLTLMDVITNQSISLLLLAMG